MPVICITDNGSVRPAATLQLRQLAKKFSEIIKQPIQPVSLQHANRIPAELLDGKPAQLLVEFLTNQLQQGQRDFILLPLFFSHNKALSTFLPKQIGSLQQQFGKFNLHIGRVIYPLPEGEPLLENIIHDHIIQTALNEHVELNNIVLVDHGSPDPQVTKVRKQLAHQVQQKLPDNVLLEQAAMERRDAKEYDFNGDLLQHWLSCKAQAGETSAIVILQFFLAGKHAGKGGDIVAICNNVMASHPKFKIAISPLIADHPVLLDILKLRFEQMIKYPQSSQC